MGAWAVGLDTPEVCSHITRAVVPMGSWVRPAMPLVRGACESVGVAVSVGDGDGLGEVGDGDGLGDVCDGEGDGLLCAGELAAGQGVDDGVVLLCPATAPAEDVPELR